MFWTDDDLKCASHHVVASLRDAAQLECSHVIPKLVVVNKWYALLASWSGVAE